MGSTLGPRWARGQAHHFLNDDGHLVRLGKLMITVTLEVGGWENRLEKLVLSASIKIAAVVALC